MSRLVRDLVNYGVVMDMDIWEIKLHFSLSFNNTSISKTSTVYFIVGV